MAAVGADHRPAAKAVASGLAFRLFLTQCLVILLGFWHWPALFCFSLSSDLGVRFVREPTQQAYGMVAVFEDLYGNRWDLLQYTSDAA